MSRSIVALLGTVRDLHLVLPDYSLGHLQALVASRRPDLLCVEISRERWESDDLTRAPVEARDALVQLSRSTDITLIPIGEAGRNWADEGIPAPERGFVVSIRRWSSAVLDRMVAGLMRLAGGPRRINSPVVEHLCGALCDMQALLADPEARRGWEARNQQILDGILWACHHDPGRRVLVAVDCRRKHWLRRRLRSVPDLTVVDYWEL